MSDKPKTRRAAMTARMERREASLAVKPREPTLADELAAMTYEELLAWVERQSAAWRLQSQGDYDERR